MTQYLVAFTSFSTVPGANELVTASGVRNAGDKIVQIICLTPNNYGDYTFAFSPVAPETGSLLQTANISPSLAMLAILETLD